MSQNTGTSAPATATPQPAPAATPPTAQQPGQTFTPPQSTAGSVQGAANPATGFSPMPLPQTGKDFEAYVQASGVQKPDGSVDPSKYDQIAAAFKNLSKGDKKAELKWLDGQQMYGLEQYCKQAGGGGGFWSSLGNAIGEAMFGGNR